MGFTASNHGGIILLTPKTEAALAWAGEHLQVESWQTLGQSIAIEPRYFTDISEGVQDDGLTIDFE